MQDLESHWDNCSEISFLFFAEPFLLFKAHKPRLKKGWNMLVLVVEPRASSHPIRWKHHNMMLWDELVSPQDETTVKQPHLTASQNTIQWSQSLLSTACTSRSSPRQTFTEILILSKAWWKVLWSCFTHMRYKIWQQTGRRRSGRKHRYAKNNQNIERTEWQGGLMCCKCVKYDSMCCIYVPQQSMLIH